MFRALFSITIVSFVLAFSAVVRAGLPSKVYGVNLGSWLVLEAWMLPQEWANMGGETCDTCSDCISSEFAFAEAYPDTVDEIFKGHWETWFNQTDVTALKEVGINTVRIPLGFWIVEALVNRTSEYFPRGGLTQLRRGLQQLNNAGIAVLLDHHGLPGVQDAQQQFTGRCTNDVEFYTPYNYERALTWTAVMTALTHLDPAFAPVVGIEAANEPIMNAANTPGYGDFQVNFVETVRAVEFLLGFPIPGKNINFSPPTSNFSAAATSAANASIFNPAVNTALKNAAPILLELGIEFALGTIFNFKLPSAPYHSKPEPLTTTFMDANWQYNNNPNPAAAAIGPQLYDNHLYYVFGGVADANPDAYMTSICNLNRVQADAAIGNSPLLFGEWGLPTQFDATDEFLTQWADAQKLAYSQGAGWVFWNFKVEHSDAAGSLSREWDYLNGVKLGYLTKDPSAYNNASVCDPYITTA